MTMYKMVNQKKGKLPYKLAEQALWNKLCVGLIVPYKVHRKRKYPLILKAVTIIDSATGWCKVTQYSNKKVMTIANLVETTWLVRYPWPVEITYGQGA